MSNTALALVSKPETAIAPLAWQEVMKVGELYAASGFFNDTQTAAQAFVKIMAGQEMGISALDAMSGLHIIKGKITVGANILARKIKSSGKYDFKVNQLDDTACVIEFFESGRSIGTSSFTIEDAKKLPQYASNPNYKSNTRNMLYARAMSNGFKWYCPDAIAGTVYTPEEMEDVPEPRNVTPKPAPVAQLSEAPSPDDAHATLIADLKAKAKNAGFSRAKELIAFIAELLNCEECQASRFTEWLNTKKRGELELVIVALEEKAIDPVEAEASAATEATEPTPHEALAFAIQEWRDKGGKDATVQREINKRWKLVCAYNELSNEQASELLQVVQKWLLDLDVS